MDKHFTVAVKVIEVTPAYKQGHGVQQTQHERQTEEALSLVVRATNEDDAIGKAIAMLETARPVKDEGQ